MLHELQKIIDQAREYQRQQQKCVLVTVVALDGSSYRKPGVRMLISQNGVRTGAVSGGCVEKEVVAQAQSVFENDKPKIIDYDGRYRLGCEGVLYMLVEPFSVSDEFYESFQKHLKLRSSVEIISYFRPAVGETGNFGSVVRFREKDSNEFSKTFTVNPEFDLENTITLETFTQQLPPLFQLLIIGAEHDAVKLCKSAALLGWEVRVVGSIKDPKITEDFPGSKAVLANSPETFDFSTIDRETAVLLMTHNYAQDLQWLLQLHALDLAYLGMLGSTRRKEQLEDELFERAPTLQPEFLENLFSPAGLNLGAVTPEEIAVSILAEILSVTRSRKPFSLKNLRGKISE
ncbi:MAG: XdhC family protein [Leeuwenhoekiella sp.]